MNKLIDHPIEEKEIKCPFIKLLFKDIFFEAIRYNKSLKTFCNNCCINEIKEESNNYCIISMLDYEKENFSELKFKCKKCGRLIFYNEIKSKKIPIYHAIKRISCKPEEIGIIHLKSNFNISFNFILVLILGNSAVGKTCLIKR